MPDLQLTADELIGRLLSISENKRVCVLDSCGTGKDGGGLLVAGIGADSSARIECGPDALTRLDSLIARSPACFFTVSYEQGMFIQGIGSNRPSSNTAAEPGVYAASFDALVLHDYSTGRTIVDGDPDAAKSLVSRMQIAEEITRTNSDSIRVTSEIPKREYNSKIEEIKELIRDGETYQTNLTQKISGTLPPGLSPQEIFLRLREKHPSEFSAFLDRGSDFVVSISPERFFRVRDLSPVSNARIIASPIKGTRPRGRDPETDAKLMSELAASEKDRAENTMIVDLLRNDLGRVCEYGSVEVAELCEIEELPSLFHLVSTIEGDVRPGQRFSDLLRALFPCGSISGCPKLRTMEIIETLEPSPRGLSMGAIGHSLRTKDFPLLADAFGSKASDDAFCFDLSVAIRTMVIQNGRFEFNVGGGIVIDSDPDAEYAESLDKAKALLAALGAELVDN